MKVVTEYSKALPTGRAGHRASQILTAMSAALLSSVTTGARAQDADVSLPPVVVQGATLALPARPKAPSSGEDEAAPSLAKPHQKNAVTSPAATPQTTTSDATSLPASIDAAGAAASAVATTGTFASSLGTALTVVTGDEIRAQQISNGADALRSLPGVTVNRGGGPAGLTEVRIRGNENNHTKVLIDGIEVNDPTTGAFDFSYLSAEDIERIEVLRGPQSGLYGSNALGGVVNIVTKGGRGPLTVKLQGEVGSYLTSAASLQASGGNDKVWMSALLATRRVKGFDNSPSGTEPDPTRINTFALKGGAQILAGVTLDFNLRRVTTGAARDGFDGPDGALATAFEDSSDFTNRLWAAGANLTWTSLGGALTQQLRVSRTETQVHDNDVTAFFVSDNTGEMLKYGYLSTYRFATPALAGARHSVTGLVEHEKDTFTARSDFADGLPHERNQLSFAGEYTGEYFNRLNITANVRHDGNDTFKDFDTWRTGVSLALPEVNLRPHASVGTGVKAPTLFEQFGFLGSFRPNPDLLPEESFGWDAGVEITALAKRAVLDVTYFDQVLTNKINTTATGAVNIAGESTRKGVEVAARWRLLQDLMLGASYTRLIAQDANGTSETRRPGNAAKLDLDYHFASGRGRFNVAAIYTGTATDDAFRVDGHAFGFPILTRETATLDKYWLVNIAASYRIAPGVEAYGRIENALDTVYREQFSYNTPGLAVYGGLKLTYEDPSTASWAKYRD